MRGRIKKKVYDPIVEKIFNRMTAWKGKLLNKAGKVCLALAVTTSMPVYTKQTHLLPNSICNQIDSMIRRFIWGSDGNRRSWYLVNWDTITSPRRYGGQGIRDMKLTNLALLGKLVWSMLHEKNKLWVQVLTHKYVDHGSTWQPSKRTKPSITWHSILKAFSCF